MEKVKSLLGNKLVIRSAVALALAVAGTNLAPEQVDQITSIIVTGLGLLSG